jgi:3-hydroxy acid dehydrogenase/malonic semialdehyde reductase
LPEEYLKYTPKCVFISGATGDFGRAFAKRFADAGSKLVLHGRNQEKLDSLKKELSGEICTVCFDISDKEAIRDGLSSIPYEFRDIDCLVNNAGGALGLEPAYECSLDDWDSMIDTNVTALLHITRYLLPGMVKNKSGHIINIGSIAGNCPYAGGNVYCAAKAFVRQFSLALRSDLKGTNVRVTNIEPGLVQTQFSLARFKGDREKADSVYEGTVPLVAEDIAESVFWVATLPKHVNINTLEVMPTGQSFAGLSVEKA